MPNHPVIALLFPGDMGTQIARELIKNGYPIITAGEGRSSRTLQNIKDTGIIDLGTLQNVVNQADVIIALTSPENSLELAEKTISCLKNTDNRPVYIDLNSNTPQTVLSIENLFSSMNIRFINGAVMGASQDIPDHATLIVSGIYRSLFIELFSEIFTIKDAGEKK
ncbi:hypothetical protein IQ37_18270 [Chryseobacterium piperi]|uniref:6-phosphogluconate dehydrogenase NADP-binding domain-containing protein n=1 Tax=Chryseobacterium piperi TaxID=558152 RepID=A0A086AGN9_9FLAO|nr:NAD(P)-binding domain-containing protein [Chryseobacterium piperi]ASW73919.1 NAD(P)-dependent oxidoreductase [Chryseobacterium piperi]KFF15853.1 hypothetical protein IQ37_18270 [Chryseobacterium piperi]